MSDDTNKDEKTWGVLAHLSALAGFVVPFGNIIGPLFIWLIKKDQYPLVDTQGKESMNFQITMTIYITIALLFTLVLIGIPFLVALVLLDLVLIIVAAVKTNDGQPYRYPMTIRFVR